MRIDAHLNLPQLVGARIPAPPRRGPDSHRPHPDDLPLIVAQTPVDRQRAVSLGAHVPDEPIVVPGAGPELLARPWAPSGGCVVSVESGLLVARSLSLAGDQLA